MLRKSKPLSPSFNPFRDWITAARPAGPVRGHTNNPMNPTVTKLFPSGALEVCAVAGGQLIRRRYFGYSKREAIRAFRATLAKEGAK